MYMIVRQVESQYLSLQTASTYPEPEDKEAFIRSQLYDYNYDGVSALPARYYSITFLLCCHCYPTKTRGVTIPALDADQESNFQFYCDSGFGFGSS